MQSAIERYLKEKGYPVSIVRAREFRNSQEVLNAKAIHLRREEKGKRPNKAQPLASEEESSLWTETQLGILQRASINKCQLQECNRATWVSRKARAL